MLSLNNIKKLVFGGLYKIEESDLEKYCPNQLDPLNDQHYGLWVPVHCKTALGEDIYYMIDTYQIDNGLSLTRKMSTRDRYISLLLALENLQHPHVNGMSTVSNALDYYYKAIIQITDENIHIFKLYIDLHFYSICEPKEIKYYNKEDLVKNIYLYDSDNYYSKGITLIKNNATINSNKKLKYTIQNIKSTIEEPKGASNYSLGKLNKLLKEFDKNGISYDTSIVYKFKRYNEFISDQQKQLEQFKKQLEI